MKASEIVLQLGALLPVLTDKFTDDISITSLTRSGSTVTATTDSVHNLKINKAVNITGAQTPVAVSSLTRSGAIGSMTTTTNHDFTQGESLTAEIEGATEVEFNGSFTIISVIDRKNITFTMDDSGPTIATGTPLLVNGESALRQYNGLKQVTAVPSTTQFQFEVTDDTLFTPASGTIIAKTLPRISAAATIERAIESYTKQETDKLWAFVVLGDVTASKNRNIESDATDNIQRGQYYRQQITQPFTVLVMIPTSQEIAGRNARDLAEDLFRPICRSLLFSKFYSGLFVGKQGPVVFSDHGFGTYTNAYYAHAYNFQQTVDILFDDTVGYDVDVAFRDITLDMLIDFGTENFTADIDLD